MAIVDIHRAGTAADTWHIAMGGMPELEHILQHHIAVGVEFLLQKWPRLYVVGVGAIVIGVFRIGHDVVVIVHRTQFVHQVFDVLRLDVVVGRRVDT